MSHPLLTRYKRFIALCLLTFFSSQLVLHQGNALASQVSSTDLLNQLDHSTPFFSPQQRLTLQRDIVQKMRDAGVANSDLNERVAALSDQDLQLLQTNFDQQAAGGDIIEAAIFVFLVLLVTDILGFTNIFPFVNHPHHPPRGKALNAEVE